MPVCDIFWSRATVSKFTKTQEKKDDKDKEDEKKEADKPKDAKKAGTPATGKR